MTEENKEQEKKAPTEEQAKTQFLSLLEAIRMTAHDLHYSASNATFYGVHLMADEIAGEIAEYEDKIKEVCFLGNEWQVPSSFIINAGSLALTLQEVSEMACLVKLHELITLAVYTIEDLRRFNLLAGEQSLLDSISENMLKKRGFIWRTITIEQKQAKDTAEEKTDESEPENDTENGQTEK